MTWKTESEKLPKYTPAYDKYCAAPKLCKYFISFWCGHGKPDNTAKCTCTKFDLHDTIAPDKAEAYKQDCKEVLNDLA